jgi:hypothetical protein
MNKNSHDGISIKTSAVNEESARMKMNKNGNLRQNIGRRFQKKNCNDLMPRRERL